MCWMIRDNLQVFLCTNVVWSIWLLTKISSTQFECKFSQFPIILDITKYFIFCLTVKCWVFFFYLYNMIEINMQMFMHATVWVGVWMMLIAKKISHITIYAVHIITSAYILQGSPISAIRMLLQVLGK